MKTIVVGVLWFMGCAFAGPEEDREDWREDLLRDEGIGLSKDALEKALEGELESGLDLEESYRKLGATDFAGREAAQKELLKGGKAALKWLRTVARSSDPEVRRRVDEVIVLLGSAFRKERDFAVTHAMESLSAEGDERKADTGGVFYEWFGADRTKLGEKYRQFSFSNSAGRPGEISEGRLAFGGSAGADGDQRLILKSQEWPGGESFGDSFLVSAKLGGESKGGGAWHLGITVGRVRALYHPGTNGGSFRFEQIGTRSKLSRMESVGFTPGEKALQWMSVGVERLADGAVRLGVTLEEGGKGKGRFETSVTLTEGQMGDLNQISLDRSGRTGGDAFFDDLLIKIR
ncbi:MAG: hypothetical protein ACJAVK_002444 [Akkermansiaceae bacterium]|jgi:hypothetical protein